MATLFWQNQDGERFPLPTTAVKHRPLPATAVKHCPLPTSAVKRCRYRCHSLSRPHALRWLPLPCRSADWPFLTVMSHSRRPLHSQENRIAVTAMSETACSLLSAGCTDGRPQPEPVSTAHATYELRSQTLGSSTCTVQFHPVASGLGAICSLTCASWCEQSTPSAPQGLRSGACDAGSLGLLDLVLASEADRFVAVDVKLPWRSAFLDWIVRLRGAEGKPSTLIACD